MPSYVLGRDGKLYIGTTATADAQQTSYETAAAAASVLGNAKDVKLNLTKEQIDTTTRENNGWNQSAPGTKDGAIEFEMQWKPGDTIFETIRDAWLNDTELFAAALDGAYDTAGSQGPAGQFIVTDFSRNEPVKEAMTASVTLKPSQYTGWYEKAGA